MQQVAAIFGKKLGEHFPVNTGKYPYREPVVTARFTRRGIEFYYTEKECWLNSIDILLGLLEGDMEAEE
jgi:hypothetical protein